MRGRSDRIQRTERDGERGGRRGEIGIRNTER